jgi:hypothetical protein
MTIKAIETTYNGYRFRSRTEARWAVFFRHAGIKFEYEPQGFLLDGIAYLPDFWLPDSKFWFEVKGVEPTETEYALCHALAAETGNVALLAVGPPNEQDYNIIVIPAHRPADDSIDFIGKYRFEDDRRNDGDYWLVSDYGDAFSFYCKPNSRSHGRMPLLREPSLSAYRASKSARFEHGEVGA